jgi:(p)ppGpp synthase/HD superfamily hydrolase
VSSQCLRLVHRILAGLRLNRSGRVDSDLTDPRFVRERSESLRGAFALARRAHAGQERKGDGTPFIGHPIRVAGLLADEGFDESVIAAALLHDVVESSELEIDDVVGQLGAEVGRLVAALTEDERIADYQERKDAHRDQVAAAGERAAAVYVADKLANVRDMRALYAEIGERAAERFTAPTLDVRIRAWRRDLEMASRVAPGLALLMPLGAELDGFEADRAARREGRGRIPTS